MMDRLANLTTLIPGLAPHAELANDVRAFAQRRIEHLRAKVEAGDLRPDKLQDRLLARFGPSAANVVGDGGFVDFDRLHELVILQQASKLQTRLEWVFGEEAKGIVQSDGMVDQDKFSALHAPEKLDHLQIRLAERFGDHADTIVRDEGSIDLNALYELFILDGNERSYDPARLHQSARRTAINEETIVDGPPSVLATSRALSTTKKLELELNR